MSDIPSYDGYARRIDAHLRARYPHLTTRLFEIESNRFLIVFPLEIEDAGQIEKDFKETIKFVTTPVSLSNELPETFLREIPTMTDAEAAGRLAGIPVNVSIFNTLMISRFPKLRILGLREDKGHSGTVLVEAPLTDEDAADVLDFLATMKLPIRLGVEVQPALPPPETPVPGRDDCSLDIRPGSRRPRAPRFVAEDEAFFFEHLERAGAGRLEPQELPGVPSGGSNCYVDFTVGDHINLRQLLLLYDTVLCSFPLDEGHEDFLSRQRLSDADLLHLVETGRLRLISTQPEERLRVPLLEAAYERNPGAVLGRRGASLLLLSDVSRTSERYRLADEAIRPHLPVLARGLATSLGVSPDMCLRFLTWPVVARRNMLHDLLAQGSKGGPARFLANDLGAQASTHFNVDVRLEALIVAERVHIGHALNATVFPALNEPGANWPLMHMLGRQLSVYQAFSSALPATWARQEERRRQGVKIMPAIPLLEFDPGIPVKELLADSMLASTRAKGRALMSRLSDLPADLRAEEIRLLIDGLRHRRRRAEGWITFENFDAIGSVASALFDFMLPPAAAVKNLGGRLLEEARRIPAVDQFFGDLQADIAKARNRNEDLDFLSRIDRVAQLPRTRI